MSKVLKILKAKRNPELPANLQHGVWVTPAKNTNSNKFLVNPRKYSYELVYSASKC